MTGTIKSYLASKQYGFIKGDDNNDYFFHFSDLENERDLAEGVEVTFDENLNPKGLYAKKVKITRTKEEMDYIVPDEIYVSKQDGVRGWINVDKATWSIEGSSRNSSDEAKNIVLNRAKIIGVNAVTNMTYSKSTDSEAGTGKGVHYFTVHHYKGIPTNIGKLSSSGKVKKESLINLDHHLLKVKILLEKKTQKNLKTWFFVVFLTIGIVEILILALAPKPTPTVYWGAAGVIFVIGLWTGFTNEDDWLQKI